jgi:hypothetical protein
MIAPRSPRACACGAALADPRRNRSGRCRRCNVLHAGRQRTPADFARAGIARSATVLAGIPAEARDTYRWLRAVKRLPAAEARRIAAANPISTEETIHGQ